MTRDDEAFQQSLTLFHRYSRQNDETVRQMQLRHILPSSPIGNSSLLDIGAGEGRLPRLLQPYVGKLVLLEPNDRCADVLERSFSPVYRCAWGPAALHRLQINFPDGFDIVTMSHMLYHLGGMDDVRTKIRMALALLKPQGHLVIVVNQPTAVTLKVGVASFAAGGRPDEAQWQQTLQGFCHQPSFYAELAGATTTVSVESIETPLQDVPNREELIALLRMALIDPISTAPCSLERLDAQIATFLDINYPALPYPATLSSQDSLIILRRSG